ncbi:MAG: PadR family transcriptional regulator [Sphingomonadales bacterium]|nr:PadR family transcriptional regulator [Sphingomonadales bacterium]
MHRCHTHHEGRRGGCGPGRPFHFAGRGPFGGGDDGEHSGGRRGGFGGPGGFGPRGHRRGKLFSGEELRLMVLALLESGPQHGYQLIRAFTEKSGEAYSPSPGVLYPLLTLLQDMGLIEEAPGEGRTRSFALTESGKAELTANREVANAALARLDAMATQAGRTDAAPVRRAMMNLRAATMQRLAKGAEDEETAFAIAALLDEVAQKIERL